VKNVATTDASGPEHTDHATGEYLPSFSSVPLTHSAIPTNLKQTTFALIQLVINYDQTGNYIRPPQGKTFAPRGSKQVEILGQDEKRAYTLGIATTLDGTMGALEQIWSGKTQASLPSSRANGYTEAMDRGFHFAFADSPKRTSHFSTLKTMKEWIQKIVKPYVDSVIEADPDLDDDQKCIIYIDIYPVHTSDAFRTFVFQEFPNIILIYVPGNCTGIFQPQDVGIQRVAKHKLKQSMLQFQVDGHQAQLAAGITPGNVKFSSSYPVLRDASVQCCVDLYDWMSSPDGRDLIKRVKVFISLLTTPHLMFGISL
jgi:hypothetical protein